MPSADYLARAAQRLGRTAPVGSPLPTGKKEKGCGCSGGKDGPKPVEVSQKQQVTAGK